jgi:hypothetical protein
MFVEQWKGWVLNILVVLLAILAPTIPFLVVFFGLIAAAGNSSSGEMPLLFWPLTFIYILVVGVVAMVLAGGLYSSALNQLRGGRVSPRDLLSAWDTFPQLLLAAILIWILASIGTMLCIIPGLLVQGLFFFTIPLIIDRRLGAVEAMKTSYNLASKNMVMFTLFALVTALISSLGVYACYVGLLVTYPLHFTIGAAAYRDCFGVPGARAFLPPEQQSSSIPLVPQPPSVVPQPATPSFCPGCQATVPQTAAYCPRCGSPLGT